MSRSELRQQLRGRRTEEVRRAFGLTALSTVLPGLGLLFTRRRRFGLLLLLFTLTVLAYFGYRVANGGLVNGAAQLLTTKGLVLLLAVFGIGGVLWIFGIMLTARETRRRGWSTGVRWGQGLFTAAMCLLVAVPAATATQYVLVTQGAFDKMFTDRFDGRGGAARGPGTGDDPWQDVPRVNFLLLGSDAGAGRQNIRTDSMIMASIDTKTGDTTLVSIPRNFEKAPIPEENPLHELYPDGFTCPNGACQMDAIWHEAGINHPELFKDSGDPNPGLNTTRDVVGAVTGLQVDYTMVVDLKGFQQLVDAMGGVTVTVPPGPTGKGVMIGGVVKNNKIVPSSIYGYVAPGHRKLGGREALWYARSRAETDDYDRMRRQRCMVNALVSQANPPTLLKKFSGIMEAAGDNISLDIPRDQLPAFADLANRMKRGNMRSVNIGKGVTPSNDPDYDKVRSLIQDAVNTPHDPAAPKSTGSASSAPSGSPTSSDASESSSDEPTEGSSSTSTEAADPIANTKESC